MTSKVLTYITIVAIAFGGGLYLGDKGNVYIPTGDTLRVGATTFQLDSITKKLYAQLDTFTKPKPIIKWKTRYDTLPGSIDTVYFSHNDTTYPARFFVDNQHIRISGMTYYSLHSPNTFDIEYEIKKRDLFFETFFTEGVITSTLTVDGVNVPYRSKTHYNEYYNHIESLKPAFWDHWYFMLPLGIAATAGTVYLVK